MTMITPFQAAPARRSFQSGFTMIELMVTLTVLALVMIVLTTVMFTAARSKTQTANRIESSQGGRVAVDMIARDIRSAGYGADLDYVAAPQPPFAYVDSLEMLINENLQPFPDTTSALGVAVHLAPKAYLPAGNPRPIRLNGTTWTPPVQYTSGAEIVRWTLDVDNDGQVNSNDVAAAEGVDARRTPNPNDYVLVRQVYGEVSAGNNGGTTERIALVRRPGGSIPPLFTVYMKGDPTPWSWSSGAVPANRLKDIERVVVQVVAPSGRADWRGKFAESTIKTEVYGIRNVPNFGAPEYAVDGYVFADTDKNGSQNGGELGLAGVKVTLGSSLVATTNAAGYFLFNAQAGTYSLRHQPPDNYKVRTNPDSFVVTVPPAVSRSFADTLVAGGWVNATVYEDVDGDKVKDASEPYREAEVVSMSPNISSKYTNASGLATLFATVGAFTMTLTVPDSFVCTTANPVTGTMTNGGTASFSYAISRQSPGHFKGTVYHDKNGSGTKSGSEGGVSNVWVGVTANNGTSVLTYGYTDNGGNFDLSVPANDPPKTGSYKVECIPPSGYYPTTASEYAGLWIQAGQVLSNYDFGVNNFQQITLNSNRVLSLASGDLIEKDWTGTKTNEARQDADLILGADAAGTDQVSVWFNQYNSSTLFTASRTYALSAPNSVLSLAVDSLSEDNAPFSGRLDVVTGTKLAGAGNFFVWYTQQTSGNEGYLPASYSLAYKTSDNGDVQAIGTADITGAKKGDIVAGTKSPTAGRGTIEIWRASSGATPTFSQVEIYPPKGSIPGNNLGEVNSLQLVDMLGRGYKDLVVGTRLSDYTGQIMMFSGKGGGSSSFRLCSIKSLTTSYVTALTCLDYNLDGKVDVVAGTRSGFNTGELQFWKNTSPGGSTDSLTFAKDTVLALSHIPISIASADLGSATNPDIVIGYRDDATNYTGGVDIYYMDGGTVPAAPLDPSGGSITGIVPAITVNNFNYGLKPSLPAAPYLPDIAVGVKTGPSTGALIVLIR
jgi:prepilin-type N-terminal cleavage/methylation domain-containing protein